MRALPHTAATETYLMREVTRLRALREHPTTGALATALDPHIIQTRDLQVIDDALEEAFTRPGDRLMMSKPSQTGKSERVAVWGPVRAWLHNPDLRIIIATHSEDLARTHSEKIRTILRTYGTGARDAMTGTPLPDRLGIGVGDKAAASRWQLAGHRGGIIACGVGTALPGRPADMLILDDLYAGMSAADSEAERRRVNLWWDSVASQRLSPTAPVIMIGTRWNEHDAHAYLMQQEPDRWRVLNFPAIAEDGVLDSLGREPGEPLENPRGETDWEAIRDARPARVWASMYQGDPRPRRGGLFEESWFDDHRLAFMPDTIYRIVAVDPADTGKGDEAGIIAGGVTADGTVILTHDWSARLTSHEWARHAVDLAIATGAHEIAVEGYTTATTYKRVVIQAWEAIRDKDGPRPDVPQPFRVHMWRGTGDALVRSTGLRNALETGRCVIHGHQLSTFEQQALGWQAGQHQPDRVGL
ncbi:hypothetical protein IU501_15095 [Nocardia otitidiscaviarum]|uniref:hypothetical protein n=1 Tax=Nocardia otitidiscaviarum TaxID=1823 RepID=UPI0018961810|nr:hypothetical protein [Nocardia otitidiscaviarum]MBF6134322.1 hypothetical protein [Nocardia otitidiscaviarum]